MVGDVGLDRLGDRDAGVACGGIAFLEFGDPAPIERTRQLGIGLERGVVIRDGVVELSEFSRSCCRLVSGICGLFAIRQVIE